MTKRRMMLNVVFCVFFVFFSSFISLPSKINICFTMMCSGSSLAPGMCGQIVQVRTTDHDKEQHDRWWWSRLLSILVFWEYLATVYPSVFFLSPSFLVLSVEVSVFFKPSAAVVYRATTFCDVTGRSKRLNLTLRVSPRGRGGRKGRASVLEPCFVLFWFAWSRRSFHSFCLSLFGLLHSSRSFSFSVCVSDLNLRLSLFPFLSLFFVSGWGHLSSSHVLARFFVVILCFLGMRSSKNWKTKGWSNANEVTPHFSSFFRLFVSAFLPSRSISGWGHRSSRHVFVRFSRSRGSFH